MSKKNWMRIFLKINWENRVFDKTKIYSLNVKNKKFVDNIFDDLYRTSKMLWTNQSTFFLYSCFCIWKNVDDKRKNRVIIDIKKLNAIIKFDVYLLFLQNNIIVVVKKCNYISIIDYFILFINEKYIRIININSLS